MHLETQKVVQQGCFFLSSCNFDDQLSHIFTGLLFVGDTSTQNTIVFDNYLEYQSLTITKGVQWLLRYGRKQKLKASRWHYNGRLWNARWQQTYQVNFHCLRSSEPVHITENNGFYLVSLLPPSVPKVPYQVLSMS